MPLAALVGKGEPLEDKEVGMEALAAGALLLLVPQQEPVVLAALVAMLVTAVAAAVALVPALVAEVELPPVFLELVV